MHVTYGSGSVVESVGMASVALNVLLQVLVFPLHLLQLHNIEKDLVS